MRDRRELYQVFVVEEFVPFRSHETSVEAEQLAEKRAVPDFVTLIRRVSSLKQRAAVEEVAGRFVQGFVDSVRVIHWTTLQPLREIRLVERERGFAKHCRVPYERMGCTGSASP